MATQAAEVQRAKAGYGKAENVNVGDLTSSEHTCPMGAAGGKAGTWGWTQISENSACTS